MKAILMCFVLLCGIARDASGASDAAVLFTRKCSSCHTHGKGDLVGPDLKGVTDRHSRAWLTAWISSSERMIRSGDASANALFQKYKQQRMPDQALSATQLSALLDFLAAGGPDAEARKRDRRADTATQAEVEMGRMLFVGQRALTGGGVACSACHRTGKGTAGGSLGPDLMRAYSSFQDTALASLLARGCFPRVPDSAGQALTDQESFALKAFLRQAEPGRHAPAAVGTTSQRRGSQ
jgi:cytochrome c2